MTREQLDDMTEDFRSFLFRWGAEGDKTALELLSNLIQDYQSLGEPVS